MVLVGVICLASTTARAQPPPAQWRGSDPTEPAPPPVTDEPPEVGGTVVSGEPLPRPIYDLPESITVVPRAELARNVRRAADDLIRTIPAAATFRRSSSLVADPTSQGFNLRGVGPSGVSRALVLRDGVPVNDPFGGWVYWRALPALDLERIEVQPSSASPRYGGLALGGVAELASRPIERRRLEAMLSTGSFDTRRAAFRATERQGDVGLALDVDALDSDGYAPVAPEQRGPIDGAAASRHLSAGARGAFDGGDAHLELWARGFFEALDGGTRHTDAQVATGAYGARFDLVTPSGSWAFTVFGGHQQLEQARPRIDDGRAGASLAAEQRVPSNNQGASATWSSPVFFAAGEHVLTLGVDGMRVEGAATETLFPAAADPTLVAARTAGGEQRFVGVFAEDRLALPGGTVLTAAVRLDDWSDVQGHLDTVDGAGARTHTRFAARHQQQVSSRVGLRVPLDEVMALRGSFYRGFRAPTLNELYRPFQVGTVLTAANPRLRPETLWGVEAGPEVVASDAIVRVTGFWNELDDPIQNVTLAAPGLDEPTRQRQNLGHAQVRGADVELAFRPARRWLATGGYTFIDSEVTAAPGREALVGLRLASVPRQRAAATLSFDDPAIATITAQWRWLGDQYDDDLNLVRLDGVHLLDASVSRRLTRQLSAFVAVENLLDARYEVGQAGVTTLGTPRMVEIGLRLDTSPDF